VSVATLKLPAVAHIESAPAPASPTEEELAAAKAWQEVLHTYD
jgi:hypothetical protein